MAAMGEWRDCSSLTSASLDCAINKCLCTITSISSEFQRFMRLAANISNCFRLRLEERSDFFGFAAAFDIL